MSVRRFPRSGVASARTARALLVAVPSAGLGAGLVYLFDSKSGKRRRRRLRRRIRKRTRRYARAVGRRVVDTARRRRGEGVDPAPSEESAVTAGPSRPGSTPSGAPRESEASPAA